MFQIRHLSTKKLAVVGSGPSSFYTILNLLKTQSENLQIDIFEKNPIPYGLVRYGIAPDHPDVKNCIDRFKDIQPFINSKTVKYFGNVEIGKTLKLSDLYNHYNGVLYAYGSNEANIPNIPGDQHPAVIDSFKFVNWYNGHPQYTNLGVDLKHVKNVTVIGNGNVAIDIVRILFSDVTELSKTDISNNAIDVLKQCHINHIDVVARRGLLDSKFTNKELRELLELKHVKFNGYDEELFVDQLKEVKLDRINKRRVSLLAKYKTDEHGDQSWSLKYLMTPIGIKVKNDELLDDVIFKRRKLVKDNDGNKWIIDNSDDSKITSLPTDLLIFSTGYKCTELSEFKQLGIKFEHGKIVNQDGLIEGLPHSYCVGWVKNGSTGNINSTVIDSENVANVIINDIFKGDDEVKDGREGIQKLLDGQKVVNWEDWNKIDQLEIENGKLRGKIRDKMTFKEMLDTLNKS